MSLEHSMQKNHALNCGEREGGGEGGRRRASPRLCKEKEAPFLDNKTAGGWPLTTSASEEKCIYVEFASEGLAPAD